MIVNQKVKDWEKRTEVLTLSLSLVFLAVIIIPFAHPIPKSIEDLFQIINITIWAIFGVDYVCKFFMAENKLVYVRSHVFELLIVILPALRPLRIIRIFPVIGYFLRYTQRSLSGKLLQYVSLAAVLITFPSAIAMYQLEKEVDSSNIKTLGDALWWAVTTATTVGYGDKFPVTTAGRILSVLVMIVGISLVGVITASVASWFVKSDETKADEAQISKIQSELREIKEELRKLSS